jgi:predicted short-subunit dehydrogenase-like oxidoreductase (DUF2520 family)
MKLPDVALVGTGRLASAFLPAMLEAGYSFVSITARTAAGARRFGKSFPGIAPVVGVEFQKTAPGLILLAVPDPAIRPVAQQLAETVPLKGAVVLHHAGGSGVELLQPAADAGAFCGVLHPLQVLGTLGRHLLPGAYARIDGSPRARQAAQGLAGQLGLLPLKFKRQPTSSDCSNYHAGASMVSNDLVALISHGVDLLMEAGVGRKQALDALAVLANGAVENLKAGGFEGALTGPVARGDAKSAAAHLRIMGKTSREGREIHRLLGRRLLALTTPRGQRPDRDLQNALSPRRPRRR